eukprot:TRINITY_DN539_c0_g1_i1.p1 TRINITY_DN539_c0_g1~~TRINITY_DN539_c0_g1_i1.p1  ORF type:complete len:543 (+),score=134.62 TRINITY_DN539_c0_g1_i1:107-1735(+)
MDISLGSIKEALYHDDFYFLYVIIKSYPSDDVCNSLFTILKNDDKIKESFSHVVNVEFNKERIHQFLRNETIGTFIFNACLKIYCLEFMQLYIGPIIERIIKLKTILNVDTSVPVAQRKSNSKKLIKFSTEILDALVNNVDQFPQLPSLFLQIIHEKLVKENAYDENGNKRFTASLFMLRYFCGALIRPYEFYLLSNKKYKSVKNKNLIKVSKMLLTLSNNTKFSENMGYVKNFLSDENHSKITSFIDSLSNIKIDFSAEKIGKEEEFCHMHIVYEFLKSEKIYILQILDEKEIESYYENNISNVDDDDNDDDDDNNKKENVFMERTVSTELQLLSNMLESSNDSLKLGIEDIEESKSNDEVEEKKSENKNDSDDNKKESDGNDVNDEIIDLFDYNAYTSHLIQSIKEMDDENVENTKSDNKLEIYLKLMNDLSSIYSSATINKKLIRNNSLSAELNRSTKRITLVKVKSNPENVRVNLNTIKSNNNNNSNITPRFRRGSKTFFKNSRSIFKNIVTNNQDNSNRKYQENKANDNNNNNNKKN